MTAIVFPIKHLMHITRPDCVPPAMDNFFPSVQTANAFVADSIVHKEYQHKCNWNGGGTYTIAASVAVFRMLNNRHWEADVLPVHALECYLYICLNLLINTDGEENAKQF